jgi:hypothetical protein
MKPLPLPIGCPVTASNTGYGADQAVPNTGMTVPNKSAAVANTMSSTTQPLKALRITLSAAIRRGHVSAQTTLRTCRSHRVSLQSP